MIADENFYPATGSTFISGTCTEPRLGPGWRAELQILIHLIKIEISCSKIWCRHGVKEMFLNIFGNLKKSLSFKMLCPDLFSFLCFVILLLCAFWRNQCRHQLLKNVFAILDYLLSQGKKYIIFFRTKWYNQMRTKKSFLFKIPCNVYFFPKNNNPYWFAGKSIEDVSTYTHRMLPL